MASFIAKQLVGDKLGAVKGAVGGGDSEKSAEELEKERELQQALADQAEEEKQKRIEKHRKMEDEREEMRGGIRSKYNIEKKEEFVMGAMDDDPNRLGRKRKTPEELAAERDLEEEEDFTSFLPESMRDTVRNVTAVPTKMISDAQEKCVIQ